MPVPGQDLEASSQLPQAVSRHSRLLLLLPVFFVRTMMMVLPLSETTATLTPLGLAHAVQMLLYPILEDDHFVAAASVRCCSWC